MASSSARSRLALCLIVAAATLLQSCVLRSRLTPKLQFEELGPDITGPQTAGTMIRWTARVSGGVGGLEYTFHLQREDEQATARTGRLATWDWVPSEPGAYRVQVVVRDELGFEVRSPWWSSYEIVPALAASIPVPSEKPPLRARAADVYWNVEATGGVAPLTYEFRLQEDGVDRAEQIGASSTWTWIPRERGVYRVKAIVRDAIGNVVDGGWSGPFRIDPAVRSSMPIAVLPFEDLTGRGAPLGKLRTSLVNAMLENGLEPLDQSTLDGFLERHRVRYVGGLPVELSVALEEETGASAALITTVERYADEDPPRLTVVSRLTQASEKNSVLWVDSVAATGHESPGLFELKRVRDIEVLLDRAAARLAESMARHVASQERGRRDETRRNARSKASGRRKFRPTGFHRLPGFSLEGIRVPRIAVLPFENESPRAGAGRLMMLHFVEQLAGRPDLDVVEPGDVRQALLQARLILEEGPSMSQADLLRALLQVDLVVAGTVSEYEDPRGEEGEPMVAFSVQGIASAERRVAWASLGNGRGGDGVVFFDVGRVYTAHGMASGLADRIVSEMLSERR